MSGTEGKIMRYLTLALICACVALITQGVVLVLILVER